MITVKNSLLTASTASLLSLGSLALTSPSYAFSLDLSSWERIGDVSPVSSTQATLNSGTANTVFTGGGAGSLEGFLGVAAGSLDPDPDNFIFSTFGSAIKQTFTNINAGDVLRFDYSFATADSDRAFVTINDSAIALGAGTPFSYSFESAGTYNVGIAVVDVEDAIGSSQLIVSNAKLNPVPEPITILGSLTALGFGVSMRRRFGRKNYENRE